jgi:TolB-like protein
MGLIAELRRRNVIRMAGLYLVGAWLLVQVAGTVLPWFGVADAMLRGVVLVLALGFVPALVFAWVFELTPEGLKRDAEVKPEESIAPRTAQRLDRMIIAVLLLALAYFGVDKFVLGPKRDAALAVASAAQAHASAKAADATPPKHAARSIAVLPFVNWSTDPENEFFSDGLSEEILNSLARIEGMQVVGRTSSFQFKGKTADLRAIGEALGVATVLEGSVRREGERARITAQLIRTSDGIHLWSETYDRTVQDSLAVQLDIAEQVAGALNVLLDDKQRARMREAGVANVDAFIAYQKGWKLYGEAHGKPGVDLLDGLRAANVEFDRATTLEPDFFEAHFAKVDLYEHSLQRDTLGQAKWLEAQNAALATLELAAANSRDQQQRLLTLAERQMLSNDWRGLRQRIDAALQAPGCNGANWLPVFASAFGNADALDQLGERAIACDPLNSSNRTTRLTVALANGKGQRALDLIKTYENGRPSTSSAPHAIALAMVGRTAEAGAELEAVDISGRPDSYALARIVVGRARGEAPAAIHAALQSLHRGQGKYDQWLVVDGVEAANAGDRVEANRLAAAMDTRPAGPFLLAVLSTVCYCGAPFDLEATPNFKARLAVSGLRWPPPPAIAFPDKPAAR